MQEDYEEFVKFKNRLIRDLEHDADQYLLYGIQSSRDFRDVEYRLFYYVEKASECLIRTSLHKKHLQMAKKKHESKRN